MTSLVAVLVLNSNNQYQGCIVLSFKPCDTFLWKVKEISKCKFTKKFEPYFSIQKCTLAIEEVLDVLGNNPIFDPSIL